MNLALDDLTMVDCTENLAGPYCSMLLADMGVQTIKIERPGLGDTIRGQGPKRNGFSLPFTMVNRNKRSLAVDLKDARGRAIVEKLCDRADIFVENRRPGAMERLGLGYNALHARNERLIYASISGFGQTGPYRERGGLDLIAQAMSGLMSVTGDADGPPAKAGFPVTDLGTGMFAAYGILTALHARVRTGRGQHIDTSLFETGVAWSVWQAAKYIGTGESPGRMGSMHPLGAPYQAFKTSDSYIVIGAASQGLFHRLCAVIGREDLVNDPRFEVQQSRMDNAYELAELVEHETVTRPSADWLQALNAAGIPCGPINSVAEMFEDPQARARQMVIEIEHPEAGRIPTIGNPVKLSETPWQNRSPAPKLGANGEAILAELGYSTSDVQALQSAGVIESRSASRSRSR
jgi:crotonobetainyl-CoA:carnitine CoA-transferase CaiB-like acyl-CoA transferase